MKHLKHILFVGLLLLTVHARATESSGETAISTSSDAEVTVLTLTQGGYTEVVITNEGTVAGFVSIDNGSTWMRLPAGPSSRTFSVRGMLRMVVKVKRVASGSNLTGIWADAN
jgi:hypothetical protein